MKMKSMKTSYLGGVWFKNHPITDLDRKVQEASILGVTYGIYSTYLSDINCLRTAMERVGIQPHAETVERLREEIRKSIDNAIVSKNEELK